MPLYHYTDEKGIRGIVKSNAIKPSTSIQYDAAYGEGVYLTGIPPTAGKTQILKNNYDDSRSITKHPELGQKAEYYVKFDDGELPGATKAQVDNKRNVWVKRGSVKLDNLNYEIGVTRPAGTQEKHG